MAASGEATRGTTRHLGAVRRVSRRSAWLVAWALWVPACIPSFTFEGDAGHEGGPPSVDASRDAGPGRDSGSDARGDATLKHDSAVDARSDVPGSDGGHDGASDVTVRPDATKDGGRDAKPDGARDAAHDAVPDTAPGIDAGHDSGHDASTPDALPDTSTQDAPDDTSTPDAYVSLDALPMGRDGGFSPFVVVGDAGSRVFATGYGSQLHFFRAEHDLAYWFFYVDDTAGKIKALRSTNRTSWAGATSFDVPLPSGSTWTFVDGFGFSVAYQDIQGTDVVHIIANVTSGQDGGPFQTYHLRTTIVRAALTSPTQTVVDSTNGGNGYDCHDDGPVTLVAPGGGVYDVTGWIQGLGTYCDTNIYQAESADLGTSWSAAAGFTQVGYFVAEGAYGASHDLVAVDDAGTLLAVFPDQDSYGANETFTYATMGAHLSTDFAASEPGGDREIDGGPNELFYTQGAESWVTAADWSVCNLSPTNIHIVRHVAGAQHENAPTAAFQEAFTAGGGWNTASQPPSVTSAPNTGLALVSNGALEMVVAVIDENGAIQLAQSSGDGQWRSVSPIPAPAGGRARHSLVGSGCTSTSPTLFWTENAAGDPSYTVMGADLSSLF